MAIKIKQREFYNKYQQMYKILFFFMLLTTCMKATVLSQDSSDTFHHNYYAPCFKIFHSKVIQAPSDFRLKNNGYYASLEVGYYFDSLGNMLDISPLTIYYMVKKTNQAIKQFNYTKVTYFRPNSISKKVANRFAKWAIKNLPLHTKIYRYPPNVRCTEQVTNRNSYLFEYRLE